MHKSLPAAIPHIWKETVLLALYQTGAAILISLIVTIFSIKNPVLLSKHITHFLSIASIAIGSYYYGYRKAIKYQEKFTNIVVRKICLKSTYLYAIFIIGILLLMLMGIIANGDKIPNLAFTAFIIIFLGISFLFYYLITYLSLKKGAKTKLGQLNIPYHE